MKKVVYNNKYGGFGLSLDAMFMLAQTDFPFDESPLNSSGYTEANFKVEGPDGLLGHSRYPIVLRNGKVLDFPQHRDKLRSHPALVTVVETLGEKANDHCAKLAIETIENDHLYRISEYDGLESVEVMSEDLYTYGYEWKVT